MAKTFNHRSIAENVTLNGRSYQFTCGDHNEDYYYKSGAAAANAALAHRYGVNACRGTRVTFLTVAQVTALLAEVQ